VDERLEQTRSLLRRIFEGPPPLVFHRNLRSATVRGEILAAALLSCANRIVPREAARTRRAYEIRTP
jgi:hypothetical protein